MTIAPAHMVQGSAVTAMVVPSRRHPSPRAAAARRGARISAWAVGSPRCSRALAARASSTPSSETTTAPIGTSELSADRAASSAARMSWSSVGRPDVTGRGGRAPLTVGQRIPFPARFGSVARRDRGRCRRGSPRGRPRRVRHRQARPRRRHRRVPALQLFLGMSTARLSRASGRNVVVQGCRGVRHSRRVPDGAGRTIRKNSSSTSRRPKTAPALRSSRSSVSAALRLVRTLGSIGEHRHLPSSCTTATLKPSGVYAESDADASEFDADVRCGSMWAYGSRRSGQLTR